MYTKGFAVPGILVGAALFSGAAFAEGTNQYVHFLSMGAFSIGGWWNSLNKGEVKSAPLKEKLKPVQPVVTPTVSPVKKAKSSSLQKNRMQAPASGSELANIERELGFALKGGEISPGTYKHIDVKLKALEKRGVNTANARALLAKLVVGGSVPPVKKAEAPRELSGKAPEPQSQKVPSSFVSWEFMLDQKKWVPSRTPPPCDALQFASPIDLSKVYAILYPGQIRGKSISDFKAHGGFLTKGETEFRSPMDGYVFQAARFLVNGVVNYGFDIASECGIMMRFGHLLELTPRFQEIADTLPLPVEGDSRTTDLRSRAIKVTKDEVIATRVGVPGQPGADWGVFDLRAENESYKDPAFREAHAFQARYDYFGLCWLDLLPPSEQAIAKALPGGDGRMGKTSEYCR